MERAISSRLGGGLGSSEHDFLILLMAHPPNRVEAAVLVAQHARGGREGGGARAAVTGGGRGWPWCLCCWLHPQCCVCVLCSRPPAGMMRLMISIDRRDGGPSKAKKNLGTCVDRSWMYAVGLIEPSKMHLVLAFAQGLAGVTWPLISATGDKRAKRRKRAKDGEREAGSPGVDLMIMHGFDRSMHCTGPVLACRIAVS